MCIPGVLCRSSVLTCKCVSQMCSVGHLSLPADVYHRCVGLDCRCTSWLLVRYLQMYNPGVLCRSPVLTCICVTQVLCRSPVPTCRCVTQVCYVGHLSLTCWCVTQVCCVGHCPYLQMCNPGVLCRSPVLTCRCVSQVLCRSPVLTSRYWSQMCRLCIIQWICSDLE